MSVTWKSEEIVQLRVDPPFRKKNRRVLIDGKRPVEAAEQTYVRTLIVRVKPKSTRGEELLEEDEQQISRVGGS